VKYGPQEALALARQARTLWVARGKNVQKIDLTKDQPSDEELLKLLLGPTGNLRAPAIRRGKQLFVGFNPDLYAAELSE
jgi:arsenate reductase-like glutaredoxin family protein